MSKSDSSAQRRINLLIREHNAPGLIAFLDCVPERELNAFVRNILLQWFESNGRDGNLSAAIAQTLLYDKLRGVDFAAQIPATVTRVNAQQASMFAGGAIGPKNPSQHVPEDDSGGKDSPVKVREPLSALDKVAQVISGESKSSNGVGASPPFIVGLHQAVGRTHDSEEDFNSTDF